MLQPENGSRFGHSGGMEQLSVSNDDAQVAGWQLIRPLGKPDADGVQRFVGTAMCPPSTQQSMSAHWVDHVRAIHPSERQRAILHIARDDRAAQMLSREAAVRQLVGGDFVDEFAELVSTDQETIAVQPWHEHRSYADLVRAGIQISAGQAVTLIVPVIECVLVALARDVLPTRLSLATCGVDTFGKPALSCWRAASNARELSTMKQDVLRQQVNKQLGVIVDAVLGLVAEPIPSHIRSQTNSLLNGRIRHDDLALLQDALFEWSAPEPVDAQALSPTVTRTSTVDLQLQQHAHGNIQATEQSHRRSPAAVRPTTEGDDAPLLQHESPSNGSKARDALRDLGLMARSAALSVRAELWLLLAGVGAFMATSALML